MKRKKIGYSNEYNKILQITDIIDAFNVFDMLEEQLKLLESMSFIEREMKHNGIIGNRKVYERLVRIKKYYIKYKVYKINKELPKEYLDAVGIFEKTLEDKSNKERVRDYVNNEEILKVSNGTTNKVHIILDPDDDLSYHLLRISEVIEITELKVAVGYLYDTGLNMISEIINNLFQQGKKFKCIIGSLQNYYKGSTEKKVKIDINKETISLLNYYSTINMQLRTLKERFYHGKIFIMKGKKVDCIIIGSSNISAIAFNKNYELNELIIISKNSTENNQYECYFEKLWEKCYDIEAIDENIIDFVDYNNSIEKVSEINKVDYKYVLNMISEDIEDDSVKERFRLWITKRPDDIYIDLEVKSLNGYVAFVYKEYNLIVLDSKNSNNGYYYFYEYELKKLLQVIKNATKTEIFKLANMKRRGYHISNVDRLENNIENIFNKGYVREYTTR